MIRQLTLASFLAIAFATPALNAQEKAFLGKTAGQWVTQLSDNDAKQRRSAAFALGKMGKAATAAVPAMKAAYAKESDTKVKESLVYALGEICRRNEENDPVDTTVEALCVGAVNDSDKYVRRSAVFALGSLANKSVATRQALTTAITDREPIVRQNAAWAVGRFGVEGVMLLKRGLADADSLVKRDSAIALLQMNDADKVHELLKDLLPLCRDNNVEVRRAALNVLVRVVEPRDRAAIAPLRDAINDPDIENRRNAALALSNIGGDETAVALPVLLEAIRNGDKELRPQAALAIRNIGPSAAKAVPELMRLLRDDPEAKMREYAALALGGIGAPAEPAIPVLVKRIQDTNEMQEIRVGCATAMGRMGPVAGATNVAPELLAILSNPQQDAKVRERVMWALRVHGENLKSMKGPKEAFTRVLKEPLPKEYRMLRYDCAYMLGMVWGAQAPNETLDVLTEFLNDDSIKIFDRTVTSTGPTGTEIKGGATGVEDRGKGDGRIMAVDALLRMGASRYAGRPALMNQLRVLAADKSTYEPLRTKSAALVKQAQ